MNLAGTPGLSVEEIRRRTVMAIYSDDVLYDLMVLKGGNALALVYDIGGRSSVDLDFSIAQRFDDTEDASRRIFQAIRNEFDQVGYKVFDESFSRKPSVPGQNTPDWWGGYELEFKLIRSQLYKDLKGDLDAIRRQCEVVGPGHLRKFKIDISHNEYVGDKIAKDLESYRIFVYSPQMIVGEKLRAICQQMPEYDLIKNKSRRARDFYDIYQVATRFSFEGSAQETQELVRRIFNAKQVPLVLLRKMADVRTFHADDWPAVTLSIGGDHLEFEEYFDFVVQLCDQLKPLWDK